MRWRGIFNTMPLGGAAMGRESGKVEVGAAMCRLANGRLTNGPVASGTWDGVQVPISCPRGSVFEGIWHTHPEGSTHLSRKDIRAGVKTGSKTLCVTVPERGETQCYRLTRRGR